jgi:DNA-binding beta-propeller fold protein YncE
MMREIPAVFICIFSFVGAARAADKTSERVLYVADKTGLSLYDIDHGHTFMRQIAVPDSGDYKGIAVSPQLGRLYLTSYKKDELISLDLSTDAVVWRKRLGGYGDSMMITPDGQRLYVPYRDEDNWKVVDAKDGGRLASIKTEHGKDYDVNPIYGVGPHNTWINPEGSRVYMSILTVPYIYVADTRTNEVIGKIGPFGKGIRPFTVSNDEKYLYANVDELLGFEIAEIHKGDRWSGSVVQRIEAHTPASRLDDFPNPPTRIPHNTPSHGINLRPDQKEVWIVDGVYGYVYAYDVKATPPKLVASIALNKDPQDRPRPGWMSFSLDGKYAYPDGGAVIDTATKKIVARIPTSEKLLEIDFQNGKPIRAGHR